MTTSVQDPYKVLGVSRQADSAEIRKAFRQLARKSHPDLHPNDPGAQERFSQINSAFQVLSDDRKRAEYDRFGSAGVGQRVSAGPGSGFGAGFGGFEDLFGDIFGGQRGQRGGSTHLRQTVELTFEEAARGCTKGVDYRRLDNCERCDGEGGEPGAELLRCEHCGGSGRLRNIAAELFGQRGGVICAACAGKGEQPQRKCTDCAGSGVVAKKHHLEVTLPAGIESGASQLLRKAGHRAAGGQPRGDVELVVEVAPHAEFVRDGDDVVAKLEVPFHTATLGGQVLVKTLRGEVSLKVPVGTAHATVLRLRGHGVPHRFRRGSGDHRVEVLVIVPRTKTERVAELVKELQVELTPKKGKSWLGRVRDWL